MSRLIILGVFIAVVGFGLIIWNGSSEDTSQKKAADTVSGSNQMSHQLKAFLEDDQSNNLDKEQKFTEDVFEEETINSNIVLKEINPSSQSKSPKRNKGQFQNKSSKPSVQQSPEKKLIVAKPSEKKLTVAKPAPKKPIVVKKSSPKKPLITKQLLQKKPTVVKKSSPKKSLIAKPFPKKPTVVRELDPPNLVASRKAAKYITTFANQPSKKPAAIQKKTGISSSDIDKELLYEEEEIAYQDAYKRSFYEDPYDREYVLENVEAYHGDLAGALTKLDIDRAVRNNDLEKLQQWLKILTVAKYPLEQKRLTESYSGTRAYIKSAIRQLLN